MTTKEADYSRPLPPGSYGLPVIGETLSFLFDPDFSTKRQKKYGSIFKTKILGRPTVIMVGPEANRFILSSDMHRFSWRDGWPNTFKELLGESLFLQEGEQHRRNRKLLMPAFHGPALANYMATMERITKSYLEKWENLGSFTWFTELKQMPYLEQVLREVERLYPPIGGGFRGVEEEFEFNGYYVPKGWMALYRINATHIDSQVYPEPERFDPDRFSPERAEHKKQEFSLVGFGGGSRICLGIAFAQMEMKIFAAHLLRHYTWELVPQQDLTLNPIPTLHPRSGLQVEFRKMS